METKYNYELIKDFLDGTLDVNTSNQISKLIQNDETARAIAKGILLLKSKFENDTQIEEYLNSSLDSNLTIIGDSHSKKSSTPILKAAAAVILLAISTYAYFQISGSSVDEIVDMEIANVYPAPPVFRDLNNAKDDFSNGIAHYRVGEFRLATEALASSSSSQAIFYRGLSLIYMKNYNLAVSVLSNKKLVNSRFHDQAKWYLSIAHLKNGETILARELLTSIASEPTHYKKEEAKLIIKALE